jgi:D-serine deaminase-like pyridoxal phosphate-dependent protein
MLMLICPICHYPADMDDRQRYDRATSALEPPFAILDLAAMRANATDLVRRAAGKPIRVATKSVRSRPLLELILSTPGFRGLMAFTLPEALWLVSHGFTDVLVAYPSADRTALARLAADPVAAREITLTVDSAAHLAHLDDALAGEGAREEIRLCLDIDAGFHALGGRFRAGALRSAVRTPDQAASLAAAIGARPGLRLVGLMAYEAQIAGVGDDPPGSAVLARAIRLMQHRSARELTVRRGRIVATVNSHADLEFVNGGGTGSIERTVREKVVTEVAAGSGFFHPRLFDHYRGFTGRPAALFALPVVRRPGPEVATVLGGGYAASGAAGPSRLPQPYLPRGLAYAADEGAGETQTPLIGPAARDLRIGDRVWFRHAKAGELCERFDSLHLVDGDAVTGVVPTYRGEGRTFL